MRMADLMVLTRRCARPPRRGEEGRCLGGELERSVVTPGALVCEVVEIREDAEAE